MVRSSPNPLQCTSPNGTRCFNNCRKNYIELNGRMGYDEIIKNAIFEGRVIDFDDKKRNDLSVIAETTRIGNITKSSPNKNLAQFLKEVKEIKENYSISYSDRDNPSVYELLGEVETLRKENKSFREDVAEGFILLKRYQDAGDYESASIIARKLREIAPSAG